MLVICLPQGVTRLQRTLGPGASAPSGTLCAYGGWRSDSSADRSSLALALDPSRDPGSRRCLRRARGDVASVASRWRRARCGGRPRVPPLRQLTDSRTLSMEVAAPNLTPERQRRVRGRRARSASMFAQGRTMSASTMSVSSARLVAGLGAPSDSRKMHSPGQRSTASMAACS
jgi:hypothetical protein